MSSRIFSLRPLHNFIHLTRNPPSIPHRLPVQPIDLLTHFSKSPFSSSYVLPIVMSKQSMGNKSSNVSQDGDSPKKKTKNEAELATKNEAGHATRSKVESEALTEKRIHC